MSGRHTCFFSLKGSTKKAGIVTKATRLLEISTSYRLRCLLFPSEGALSFIQHVRKQARKGSSSELLGGGAGSGRHVTCLPGGPTAKPTQHAASYQDEPCDRQPPQVLAHHKRMPKRQSTYLSGDGSTLALLPNFFPFFFLRHC